jgi:hypothetical protein
VAVAEVETLVEAVALVVYAQQLLLQAEAVL